MEVPFLDFARLNAPYRAELERAVAEVIKSGRYILGPEVARFERAFSEYIGAPHAIGVGNGFDALSLILRGYKAMGIMADGDEVIVPANTYVATILAVTHNGLVPVLVEPDPGTFLLADAARIEASIGERTRAVITVHLYGQVAHSTELEELARTRGIRLIEDASQAHGAAWKGRLAGNLGDAAAFSLYPSKPLGAVGGDAGIATTADAELARVMRSLRNYGSSEKYVNELKGVNSRLDEIQAAMLTVKLAHLDAQNQRRREIARRYRDEITNPRITLPLCTDENAHVWHLFVTRTANRDGFMAHLAAAGVGSMIHYPIPPHRQAAYAEWSQASFPVSETIHDSVLSIPMHHRLAEAEVTAVIEACNAFR